MEIVDTACWLFMPPKDRPGRAQIGDVARLANGRLVARVRFDFSDGTHGFACRDYDPDQRPEMSPQCIAPTDWNGWINEELDRVPGRYRQLEPRDYERERAELEKFQAEWPFTAARIAAAIDLSASPAPVDLFELGPVLCLDKFQTLDWRAFADRHAAGSFGLYSEYTGEPLTDEELWTLAEQPVCVANRASIAAQSGPIRSRWALSDKPMQGQAPRKQRRVLNVLTVLSPRGPRTLMTPELVDAEP